MKSRTIASIDRRIVVVEGSEEQKRTISRISALREIPYVVLLGEPGGGKTTVLLSEAERHETRPIKVRSLLNGASAQGTKWFLDALDEYRSDGQQADKIYRLANVIGNAGVQSWWLSCRAEDWRNEADLQSIREVRATTDGQPIVVVQLQALDYQEAAAILRALGEGDPESFLDKAYAMGAEAFTHNPLSLQLLHKAVGDAGSWPKTRYALFDAAARNLAHEESPDRKYDHQRPSPDVIMQAAERSNLILLVSGARALWRSNAMPPDTGRDRRELISHHDLGIDHALLRYTLDTALYRGEGEAFEPMHRTIAEFTAARALASAVKGESGRAAFPLGRALALITAQDGCAPSELRGLFAWLAAHLAVMGDSDGVQRLIEVDAPTVMSYGDAAVFDIESRRSILRRLTRATPYFTTRDYGSTSVAGLAGEDLAEDFAAILRGPEDGSQLTYSILLALSTGVPVQSIKPLLREIVLDPVRPDWVRWRAADAWLNGHPQPAQGRRELFDALAQEPISESRENVRMHLVEGALDPTLTTADLRSLISAFRESGRSRTVGRMTWLENELRKRPRPDLFETPIKSWLRENTGPDYQYELDEVMDVGLAAVIRAEKELNPVRLLHLVENAGWYAFPHLKGGAKEAIREWLEVDPGREIALLFAIRDALPSNEGPWMTVYRFENIAGRLPGEAVVRRLLVLADESTASKKPWLELVYYVATRAECSHELWWLVFERLEETEEMLAEFNSLRVCRIEQHRLEDMKRKAMRIKKERKQHAKNNIDLTRKIPEIATALRPGILEWGARCYFGRNSSENEGVPPGIDAVVSECNEEIADAILLGWRNILAQNYQWPSVEEIGGIHAQGNYYFVEFAALAGLDVYLSMGEQSALDKIPLDVAISTLRMCDMVRYKISRSMLKQWAIDRLCRNVDASVESVVAFWISSIEGRQTGITLLHPLARSTSAQPLLQRALPRLLRVHPTMPPYELSRVLATTAKCLAQVEIRPLVDAALADRSVRGISRRLWLCVDFALNPARYDTGDVMRQYRRTVMTALDLSSDADALIDALDFDDENRALRRALMVRIAGRFVTPSKNYSDHRPMRGMLREEVVRKSIQQFASMTCPTVVGHLSRLIEDPDLKQWRKELMHARFEHMRLVRDQTFVHPMPRSVADALAGGDPINSSDLRAIVHEELLRLRRELRTQADSPWREYWDNVDKKGVEPTPKIENRCRDHLILRLVDRMRAYGIKIVLPEVQHAEKTRSDIAIFSHAGRTYPIEIKRDSNESVWTAASTQLQHYASANTADGTGTYLVFWFDHSASRITSRPDKGPRPRSAQEFEQMLINDLPVDLRSRVDVVVFDVSDHDGRFQKRPKSRK